MGYRDWLDAGPHPRAVQDAVQTGIDYARLLDEAHQAELAQGINYAALTGVTDQIPGQLDLLTGGEVRPANGEHEEVAR